MSDFKDVVKHLDILPTRKATKDEATQNAQPFSKYYELDKTRKIEKINEFLVIPIFNYPALSNNGKLYRFLGQCNITMPKDFYILNAADPSFNAVSSACFVCIKWRVGTTVYRYDVGYRVPGQFSPFFNSNLHFEYYNNQKISKNCVIELWRNNYNGTSVVGLIQPMYLKTSLEQNPSTPDDTQINLPQTVLDQNAIGFAMPAALPIDNTVGCWNSN